MNNILETESMSYMEGSGVGVLDLHLLSSFANESIVESVFAGLILLLPLLWFWYLRNAIWRKVIVEKHSDFIGVLEKQDGFGIRQGAFFPWCSIQSNWNGKELMIRWSTGLWWETCLVSYDGIDQVVECIDITQIKNIVQLKEIQENSLISQGFQEELGVEHAE